METIGRALRGFQAQVAHFGALLLRVVVQDRSYLRGVGVRA